MGEVSESVVVVERDPSYRLSSTALSAASFRTQFGTDFLRTIRQRFGAKAVRLRGDAGRSIPTAWTRPEGEGFIMHAPAAGRGVAELTTRGRFETIDLTPLGYGRIRSGTPVHETVVYQQQGA